MGRKTSLPILFDDCKQISITSLKGWGYLEPGQIKSGTIKWSRNGETTGEVSIKVSTLPNSYYLQLDYRYNQEQVISYKVSIVALPSNIGKGEVLYFLCPTTSKRCRKLFLGGRHFLHRSAFKDSFYQFQVYGHNDRAIIKRMDASFKRERAFEKLHSKHFRKTYKGKPTNSYKVISKKISTGDRLAMTHDELCMAMVKK